MKVNRIGSCNARSPGVALPVFVGGDVESGEWLTTNQGSQSRQIFGSCRSSNPQLSSFHATTEKKKGLPWLAVGLQFGGGDVVCKSSFIPAPGVAID